MIVGLPTSSSKPSRRIISIRIASWSSPRPDTRKVSGESVSSTWIPTLLRRSFQSRSRSWVEVTNRPSRPAKGETFEEKSIETVGSSSRITGSAPGCWSSAMEPHRGVEARGRDGGEERVEQRREGARLVVERAPGDALARVGVEHGEVELRLLGVEVDEEVVDLVEHLGRAGVLPVDLVDD